MAACPREPCCVDGHPSDDAYIVEYLVRGDGRQGSLAPLGGIKGLGLAMCAEFVAGALTGGFHAPPPGKPWGEGALVVALSASLFHTEHLLDRIQTYLSQFTTYPGLHAQQLVTEAVTADAIEYPEPVLQALNTAAQQRGLAERIAFN